MARIKDPYQKSGIMAAAMKRLSALTQKYPITRGMITYSILWPSSNICQQIIHERDTIDLKEAARFSLFGCFYVAPTFYAWFRLSSRLFPGNTLKQVLKKVSAQEAR